MYSNNIQCILHGLFMMQSTFIEHFDYDYCSIRMIIFIVITTKMKQIIVRMIMNTIIKYLLLLYAVWLEFLYDVLNYCYSLLPIVLLFRILLL